VHRTFLKACIVIALCGCNKEHKVSKYSGYKAFSAVKKQSVLWSKIVSSEYIKLPPLEKADIISLIFKTLDPKMENRTDFSAEGWVKSIH
jgi:hypothetical protein